MINVQLFDTMWPFGLHLFLRLRFQNCVFPFFFFFFCSAAIVDFVNCEQCIHALFTVSQITLFSNFFIKNGSHSTIYIFKNYFAIVFSVSVFSFSKNKLNSNIPIMCLDHSLGHRHDIYSASSLKKKKCNVIQLCQFMSSNIYIYIYIFF